ncbi:MAG: Trm112 family protein [Promethearchaeota archaeon]
MKPWLFDILACPIDKHFPLKLFIFGYETPAKEFQTILNVYAKRDLDLIKNKKIIEISKENDSILIKDNIVLEFTPLDQYLKKIIASIEELEHFEDRSRNELSSKCFELCKTKIKEKLIEFQANMKEEELDSILPELFFLNQVKLEIEIESGVLFCEKCKRWYPIIETIPQMLPDQYREKRNDLAFLKNHKHLLDIEFLNQDLKPFTIDS